MKFSNEAHVAIDFYWLKKNPEYDRFVYRGKAIPKVWFLVHKHSVHKEYTGIRIALYLFSWALTIFINKEKLVKDV